MARPRLELADIFRTYGDAYRQRYGSALSSGQQRVMRAIEMCRTATLGGHVDQCDHCGHQVISYNSCRNRHCPKCQCLAKAKWLAARQTEILPVEYYHVVFTLPESIGPIALQNREVVYGILFQAASQTLLTIAADPKHLGAHIGFTAVLHTWGQNLLNHPHLHCVVPGGGLATDAQRWIACRPGFFLPVRVLSRLYRRLFLARLRLAFEQGRLAFHGNLEALSSAEAFDHLLLTCGKTEWIVYAKPPFGGPAKVLDYLARYTHRIAISNHRLLSAEDGKVTFTWKNYRQNGRQQIMTLDAHEFIRRFLLHVVPNGFVRIRYYGMLANCHRAEMLRLCRKLLGTSEAGDSCTENKPTWAALLQSLTGDDPLCCPACQRGRLVRLQVMPPSSPFHTRTPAGVDSS